MVAAGGSITYVSSNTAEVPVGCFYCVGRCRCRDWQTPGCNPEAAWMRALLEHLVLGLSRGWLRRVLRDPSWWSPRVPPGPGPQGVTKLLGWLTRVVRKGA